MWLNVTSQQNGYNPNTMLTFVHALALRLPTGNSIQFYLGRSACLIEIYNNRVNRVNKTCMLIRVTKSLERNKRSIGNILVPAIDSYLAYQVKPAPAPPLRHKPLCADPRHLQCSKFLYTQMTMS